MRQDIFYYCKVSVVTLNIFRFRKQKQPNLNIFCTYILVIVAMGVIFYPLFPILLNYPPSSINTKFDIEFSHIPYYQQYVIIILLIMLLSFICFKLIFKNVSKWNYITKVFESNNVNAIQKIRQKSFLIPHFVYLMQILIPVALVGILFIILGFHNSADVKFFILLTVGLTFTGVISYLFSKKYFRQVLKYTYLDNLKPEITRIGLRLKFILQLFPLFLFSFLFISLVGQSGLLREKGNALFKSYQREIQMKFEGVSHIQREEEIQQFLKQVRTDTKDDITFYIKPDGSYKTSDNSRLSDFFLKYTKELAFEYYGHTYDYYGSDFQGAVIKLPGLNGDWILGIKYIVSSPRNFVLIIISFMILSIFVILVLLYFAKTFADDIALIALGLEEIAEGSEADLNKKIAVISNDEIGDLAIAFNKVQEREKKYIEDIKKQQSMIVERERLVSLGQMISGITHNLKTPIMSLSVGIASIKELVAEYQASIDDQQVTPDDHREIAADMGAWLNEMTPCCTYMSDVLTTIKGQIIPEKSSRASGFALKELMKRVEILTDYELNKSGCSIQYDLKVNPDLDIPGEVSNLVQVLENLISNAIQAYEGKKGLIEFKVTQQDTALVFCIRDSGQGIPEELQSKLFKEMITTKGKKGTGLGLYISYAIIKGKFGGDLWFESAQGQDTAFYISIPI